MIAGKSLQPSVSAPSAGGFVDVAEVVDGRGPDDRHVGAVPFDPHRAGEGAVVGDLPDGRSVALVDPLAAPVGE